MSISTRVLAIAATLLAIPAMATNPATPAVVSAVYQCRALADNAARLACFDKAAAELEQAEHARTLVFGDEDSFQHFEGAELASTIQAVRTNVSNRLVFTLADGTRWLQTDKVVPIFPPKAGDKITLRRGLLGNYRASTRGTGLQVRQIG